MYERATCTCGKSLGPLILIYKHIYNEKAKIIGSTKLVTHMGGSIAVASMRTGDILDQLGIYKICCRSKIITNVEFFPLLGIGINNIQHDSK